ncbi:MAG: proteasome subunit alpha [Myxococcota bacterium]|jgi:proteasome alpha subunit|nr:proteasome subunit alpha [Myxococcota bacterium]
MSMPFYVSPEQVMADKAEFARKGIARGKSIVALEFAGGVLLIAENATDLSKVGEIYDRIAFAGVGKFSEFDTLRKIGVRFADSRGYAYSRDDVRGKALANAYSQAMGEAFTREMKPLEVEIIVAEVGDDTLAGHENNALYRVKFDGFISDHKGFVVIGGNVDDVESVLNDDYQEGMSQGEAVKLGLKALTRGSENSGPIEASNLEVCILDRGRSGRKFARLSADDVHGMLGE